MTRSERLSYGECFLQNEYEMSKYNLEVADVSNHRARFDLFDKEARAMLAARLPLPAYDNLLKTSQALLPAHPPLSQSSLSLYPLSMLLSACRTRLASLRCLTQSMRHRFHLKSCSESAAESSEKGDGGGAARRHSTCWTRAAPSA